MWSMKATGATRGRQEFDPTPQQAAIFDALESTRSNLIVEARAGTGKSVTCCEAMWRVFESSGGLPPSQLYLTFSKSLADEFKRRTLPPGAVAATYHSHCYRAVRRAFNSRVVDHPNAKTWDILDGIHGANPRLSDASFVVRRRVRNAVCKLVSLTKNTLCGVSFDALDSLAVQYGVDVEGSEEEVYGLAAAACEVATARTDLIDFDDQLYLAWVHRLSFPPVDVLYIDEAQDLNRLQQELIPRICPRGRVVIVGDRFQAIFGFRGADSNSIPRLQDYLGTRTGGLIEAPLTETFRCPKSHVARVNRLVPDYVAHASNPDGVVRSSVPLGEILSASNPGDMLLCRNTAPLVSACLRLMAAGCPAVVRGRDVGAELVDLVTSWQPVDVDDMRRRLSRWTRKQLAKWEGREDGGPQVERINDTALMLSVVADSCETAGEVLQKLRSLFSESLTGKIVLSSVHRAKGLEANRVAILRPDLLGGGKARTEEERQQERNLEYVAGTRSKSILEVEETQS